MLQRIEQLLNLWDFEMAESIFLKYLNDKNVLLRYFKYLLQTGRFNTLLQLLDTNNKDFKAFLKSQNLDEKTFKDSIINALQQPQKSIESLKAENPPPPATPLLKEHIACCIIEHLLQNEANYSAEDLKKHLYYFYQEAVHEHSDEISFGYYVSKMMRYFLSLPNEVDFFTPKRPFSIPYRILHKLYFSNAQGARVYFNAFNERLRGHLSEIFDKRALQKTPKIAICLYGMLRGEWINAINNISCNLAQPLNADIFIFTWDEYQLWPGLGGGYNWLGRKCDDAFVNEIGLLGDKNFLYQNFPNVSLKLETEYMANLSESDVQKLSKIPNLKSGEIGKQQAFNNAISPNHAKMFYGIYQSFEVMKKYEKAQGFLYDFVFSVRIDIDPTLHIENLPKLHKLGLNEIADDIIDYGGSGTGNAYGRREAMEIYAQLHSIRYSLECDLIGWMDDNHELFFKWELYNGLTQVKPNLAEFSLIGNTSITKGYAFPNITKELAMDLKNLEGKFSKKELDEFKKTFQKIAKYFKAKMPKDIKAFNRITKR